MLEAARLLTMITRGVTALALTIVALVVAVSPAVAAPLPGVDILQRTSSPLDGSDFQGGDGNQTATALLKDWQSYAGAMGTVVSDPSDPDKQFTGSDEAHPIDWDFSLPSESTPAKTNFRAIAKTFDQDTYLYLAFRRAVNQGNSFLAFELNQDARKWRNGETFVENGVTKPVEIPCRTTGDLLITFFIDNADADQIQVLLQKWTSSTSVTAAEAATYLNGVGCAKTGTLTAVDADPTNAQGAINNVVNNALAAELPPVGTAAGQRPNAGSIPGHLETTTCDDKVSFICEGLFGETALNLADIFQESFENPCFSFGSLWAHGRASESASSSLQDYVEPVPIVVRRCTAEGVKYHDVNANGVRDQGEAGLADWRVWADYDENGVLDAGEPFDDTDASGAYTVTNINPGGDHAYDLREMRTPGQSSTGWSCSDPSTGTGEFVNGATPAGGTPFACGYGPIDATVTAAAVGKDFGNYQDGSIAGRKFEDADADGAAHETGEAYLPGWEIYLDLDDSGSHDPGEPKTTTDADGAYSFTGVEPGTYVVREVLQSGWTQSVPAVKHTVTVTSGEAETGHDFGNYEGGSVSGAKFEDDDADGAARETGEDGLAGWEIYLDSDNSGTWDAGEPKTTTDGTGAYAFAGLTPGTYVVREVQQSGWTQSFPASGSHTVTVTSGEAETGHDFGNYEDGSISGAKFEDDDADGAARETGEDGLAGWEIYLDADDSGSWDVGEPKTSTDGTGAYTFAAVTPGTYVVREVQQSGWTQSFPAGVSHTVTVSSGEDETGKDFGNYRQASISGIKFEDADGDGTGPETGEQGLSGWTIYLDTDGDGQLGAGEPSTTTGAGGAYSFTGLEPGETYTVREVQQSGWHCSVPSPCAYSVAVVSGQSISGRDFGNWDEASISGRKFEDSDGDGAPREQDEPYLAGWTVYLDLDGNGAKDAGEPSDVTDADGRYSFDGLTAGDTYTVREVQQTGWTNSFPATGSHDVTVSSGAAEAGRDFGNWEQASISGRKFEDVDNDGAAHEDGEPYLAGWTIYLDLDGNGVKDDGEPSDVTDAEGRYSFEGLTAGEDYTVREVAQDGWSCAYPDPCAHAETPQSGDALTGRDFGNAEVASISGRKFEDLDADGAAREEGEPYLAGWTIYLDLDGNGVKDDGEPSDVTDADGRYAFADLESGRTYVVRELVEGAAWHCSYPESCSYALGTQSGDELAGRDFGNYEDATVTGRKYADLDEDGAHDEGEPYLEGWTMYADLDGDGQLGEGEPSDVTDEDGAYSFVIEPSQTPREIREIQQDGWTCTAPASADEHGCVHTVTLLSGDTHTGDFGNFRAIFIELDKDGDKSTAHAGDTVSYTITVTNGAEEPLTFIEVTDQVCTQAGDDPVRTDDGDGDDVLSQGESWVYECAAAIPGSHAAGDGDFVNVASVLGRDRFDREVTDEDSFVTTVIHPDMEVDKTVRLGSAGEFAEGPIDAHVGETVQYRFALTNPGDTPLSVTSVDDPRCDGSISGPVKSGGEGESSGDGLLDPGETWTYTCSRVVLAGDAPTLHNVVTVSGTDVLGGPKGTVTDSDEEDVNVLTPGTLVVKEGNVFAYPGDTVTYTFAVSNTGNTPLRDVVVTDDRCAPVSAAPVERRNDNEDAWLDRVGVDGVNPELWIFTCSVQIPPAHAIGEENPIRNVATATGTDRTGRQVSSTDDHLTTILHPDIDIEKAGLDAADQGDVLDYVLTVTNPGDVAFASQQVVVTDPQCDAPPVLTGKNRGASADPTPSQLDPGDTWLYACSLTTNSTQTLIDNVADVTGTDPNGRVVTDSDRHPTALRAVLVAQTGRSRLQGPSRCVSSPFTLRVSGRQIQRVVVFVDGAKRKTLKARSGRMTGQRFAYRVDPRRYRDGVHRIRVRVTYVPEARTRGRDLRMTFQRCARQVVKPVFTG